VNKPKKNFGQNFLTDQIILGRIIDALSLNKHDEVLEIGCGKGALTERILAKEVNLRGVEIDRDLIEELNLIKLKNRNLDVLNKDILKINLKDISESKLRIVGNLPYNISSKIMLWSIKNKDMIEDVHFMLQKEFAERLISSPNKKSYGRLSILAQLFFNVEELFDVPSESFFPEPKVDSLFLRLKPKENKDLEYLDIECLQNVTLKAFTKRRKKISSGLKELLTKEDLKKINIDPGLRPENLSIADYISITKYIQN
tara:strand:+ start:3769 stop:4539 length:771 start_codon:yes stop_codon:yes gene_type:complete